MTNTGGNLVIYENLLIKYISHRDKAKHPATPSPFISSDTVSSLCASYSAKEIPHSEEYIILFEVDRPLFGLPLRLVLFTLNRLILTSSPRLSGRLIPGNIF